MILESPWSFAATKDELGFKIEYSNLMELCQGCPLAGHLHIDSQQISPNDKFGGPSIVHGQSLFVPIYYKTFFKTGFKLAEIDLVSKSLKIHGKLFPLIHLIEIKDREITFYTDMDKTLISKIEI